MSNEDQFSTATEELRKMEVFFSLTRDCHLCKKLFSGQADTMTGTISYYNACNAVLDNNDYVIPYTGIFLFDLA